MMRILVGIAINSIGCAFAQDLAHAGNRVAIRTKFGGQLRIAESTSDFARTATEAIGQVERRAACFQMSRTTEQAMHRAGMQGADTTLVLLIERGAMVEQLHGKQTQRLRIAGRTWFRAGTQQQRQRVVVLVILPARTGAVSQQLLEQCRSRGRVRGRESKLCGSM